MALFEALDKLDPGLWLASLFVPILSRWRFPDGPVGFWCTSSDDGSDMAWSVAIQFEPNGAGKLWSGGGLSDGPDTVSVFRWKSVGPRTIEITMIPTGDEEKKSVAIRYGFAARRALYGKLQTCMYEIGKDDGERREKHFWWMGCPLVYQGARGPEEGK